MIYNLGALFCDGIVVKVWCTHLTNEERVGRFILIVSLCLYMC